MKKLFNKLFIILMSAFMMIGVSPITNVSAKSYYHGSGTATVYCSPKDLKMKVAHDIAVKKKTIVVYYTGSASDLEHQLDVMNSLLWGKYQYANITSHITGIEGPMRDGKYMKATITNVDYEMTPAMDRALSHKIDTIINGLHLKGSAYSKAVKINDYVVSHVKYDTSYKNTNAYDALMKGKSTCGGYSQAFYLLAQRAKINVKMVGGKVMKKDGLWSHQWDFFKSGQTCYVIDPCWNDSNHHHKWIKKGFNLPKHMLSSGFVSMAKRS